MQQVAFPSIHASWFFGVNVLDLDFGVHFDSIEQPIKRNSVDLGKHVSLWDFSLS